MEEQVPAFVDEARRMGYQVLPPCVNESDIGFTPTELVVRFGLSAIKGIGDAASNAIVAARPYASYQDFVTRVVEPKGSKVNRGHLAILARCGALDALVPNRHALEVALELEASGVSTRCVRRDDSVAAVNGLPCTYDWANEPKIEEGPEKNVVTTGRGKAKQTVVKPPPKKCTVACRRYQPPPALDLDGVEPYTPDDVRRVEREVFNVPLSSTPFDRLPEDELLGADSAADVEAGGEGEYLVVGVVSSFEVATSKNGNPYGRLALATPDGSLDVVVWREAIEKYRGDLRPDALVVAVVQKKPWNGGWSQQLSGLAPV
jgi:DNA polymerase III subunit alpha